MILSVTRTSAALSAACMALGGCAAARTGGAPETAPPPPSVEAGGADGACDASILADLVGQPATEALAADAMKRSGAHSLRWIAPGTMVTQDYREDRLNIELDAANKVISSRCG